MTFEITEKSFERIHSEYAKSRRQMSDKIYFRNVTTDCSALFRRFEGVATKDFSLKRKDLILYMERFHAPIDVSR